MPRLRTGSRLRSLLRYLYHGGSPTAVRFRIGVLVMDLALIGFFIATPLIRESRSFLWLDYAIAAVLALDIMGRALASLNMARRLRRPTFWVDVFILLTLLFPAALAPFGFLRILRLWSLSRTGFLWRPLKRLGLQRWEEAARSVASLLTFLFVVTGFVYTFFFRTGAGFDDYINALYFTVATVTTTGFGDVTLPGPAGKLTSIVTMIIGITLFVRLAQALFRPDKVFFPCPQCALQRHDYDAVHCKACGHVLAIPDEGG